MKGGHKLRHRISTKAICPHYKHETSQVIDCDGIKDGTVVHLAFARRDESMKHKRSFCHCDNYKECEIYKMIEGVTHGEVRK